MKIQPATVSPFGDAAVASLTGSFDKNARTQGGKAMFRHPLLGDGGPTIPDACSAKLRHTRSLQSTRERSQNNPCLEETDDTCLVALHDKARRHHGSKQSFRAAGERSARSRAGECNFTEIDDSIAASVHESSEHSLCSSS